MSPRRRCSDRSSPFDGWPGPATCVPSACLQWQPTSPPTDFECLGSSDEWPPIDVRRTSVGPVDCCMRLSRVSTLRSARPEYPSPIRSIKPQQRTPGDLKRTSLDRTAGSISGKWSGFRGESGCRVPAMLQCKDSVPSCGRLTRRNVGPRATHLSRAVLLRLVPRQNEPRFPIPVLRIRHSSGCRHGNRLLHHWGSK